MSGEHCYFTC